MKTKFGKLMTRKRTWASIISFVTAVGVPAAMVACPEYAVPIASGAAALNALSGSLSGKSALDSAKVGADVAETVKGVKAVQDGKKVRKSKKVASDG